MGLTISLLRSLKDRQIEREFREDLTAINQLLTANNLPQHFEPEKRDIPSGQWPQIHWGYSGIHYLRRLVYYRENEPDWSPMPSDGTGDIYKEIPENYVTTVFSQRRSHLCCHSDCGGFYVPVNFQAVLGEYNFTGSCQALLEELEGLRVLIQGQGLLIEESLLRELIPLVRFSVEEKTAILFC